MKELVLHVHDLSSDTLIKKELRDVGVVAIRVMNKKKAKQLLDEFHEWMRMGVHEKSDASGIIKSGGIGHASFMKKVRALKSVIAAFECIWNVKPIKGCKHDMVCSFDGACYMSADTSTQPQLWPHCDQHPTEPYKCYQSSLNLIDNSGPNDGGLVVWPKSLHLINKWKQEYASPQHRIGYFPIKQHLLDNAAFFPHRVVVPPGVLVIWNSKTVHCNTPPKQYGHDRAVLYICMMPRKSLPDASLKKLELYKKNKWTTNHSPRYPVVSST
jgi:hypothetical protein